MIYWFPPYMKAIEKKLIDCRLVAHNFQNLDENDLYNPSDFRYQIENFGVTYTLNLDLNVYQFILNSYKKPVAKKQFQDAIALVVFCQMSGIVLEPSYAVYEKIGYDTCDEKMNEILNDLELFYRIDNTDSDLLAQYALGNSQNYVLGFANPINKEYLAKELTKYRRLTEWDSMYLFMLKLACLHVESDDSPATKLTSYIEWLVKEFRLSLVATVFAVVFFGKKPLPKMLKFKTSQTRNKKRASINNMTWDLYIMNEYFRSWVSQGSKQELMYASGDKAFLGVLNYAIKIQETGSLQCMHEHLSQELLAHVDQLTLNPSSFYDRVYQSKEWTPDYRARLIDKYESQLGIGEK
ncbi:hypothetical protein HYN73_22610 [Vibrio parahaemolyticus]|uniref:hypothetical protein n=2 Tax=Vibrionaceae TaxID=641 RepID=UPI00117D6380|nr:MULTISPECIES: hypothetical protein [Vibrio]EJL6747226.1 hypothetical protein [Vibrio alginolyticus]MBM5193840.1 hypothetical protein [Vibrio parahaemolyticus]MBM5207584.1 hypothetical protein [Vibrio parahaemolyticus]MBM5212041.1 hypothetical protein [Vibrio parahaemolyticus]MBM5264915.1 hypothetical protein [Vibrio parahaemolyticus]